MPIGITQKLTPKKIIGDQDLGIVTTQVVVQPSPPSSDPSDETLAVAYRQYYESVKRERDTAIVSHTPSIDPSVFQIDQNIDLSGVETDPNSYLNGGTAIITPDPEPTGINRIFFDERFADEQKIIDPFEREMQGLEEQTRQTHETSMLDLERDALQTRDAEIHSAQEQYSQTMLTWEQTQKSTFEKQLTDAEIKARSEWQKKQSAWEKEQRTAFEAELKNKEREAKQKMANAKVPRGYRINKELFRRNLARWKKKSRATFERELKKAKHDFTVSAEWKQEQWTYFDQFITDVKFKSQQSFSAEVTSYETQFNVNLGKWQKKEDLLLEVNIKDWWSSERKRLEQEVLVPFRESWTPETLLSRITSFKIDIPRENVPFMVAKGGVLIPSDSKETIPYHPISTQMIIAGVAVTAPIFLPVTTTALLATSGIGVLVSEGISLITTGKFLPHEQVLPIALKTQLYTLLSVGALTGFSNIAPTIAASRVGRAGINTLMGGITGFVESKGDPKATATGMLFGGGISLGMEYIAIPLASEIKARLNLVNRLTPSTPTLGKSGEPVSTWVSDPISQLDDMGIRVIADVTENPIGVSGRTLSDVVDDYVGKSVPTGHATLKPDSFNLEIGGKTLLKGFPSEASGFRSAKELYHFYSAPSTLDDFVNVYGGYMGVGDSYSDSMSKIVFGGKPTALVTLDTLISPEFLKRVGESVDDYLARISGLSGVTGLSPETLLSKSAEIQVSTPASYERFGEQLAGSIFASKGSIGTFQIKTLPKGLLGKIPILRTMFSKYTDFKVVLGTFQPVTPTLTPSTSKTIEVGAYNLGYVPSTVISSASIFAPSLPIFSLSVKGSQWGKPSLPSLSPSSISIKQSPYSPQSFKSEIFSTSSSIQSSISSISLPSLLMRSSISSFLMSSTLLKPSGFPKPSTVFKSSPSTRSLRSLPSPSISASKLSSSSKLSTSSLSPQMSSLSSFIFSSPSLSPISPSSPSLHPSLLSSRTKQSLKFPRPKKAKKKKGLTAQEWIYPIRTIPSAAKWIWGNIPKAKSRKKKRSKRRR